MVLKCLRLRRKNSCLFSLVGTATIAKALYCACSMPSHSLTIELGRVEWGDDYGEEKEQETMLDAVQLSTSKPPKMKRRNGRTDPLILIRSLVLVEVLRSA